MEKTREINFGYANKKIRLLEWEVRTPFVYDDSQFWEPEFDVNISEKDDKGQYTYTIDANLYLRQDKDKYVFMIKTRNEFKIALYEDEILRIPALSLMMDNAIAHTRAICIDKDREENLGLPMIPYFNPAKLSRYAELRLFTTSLNEFSYERRRISKKLSAIVGNMNIGIEEFRKYIIKFEPKPITHHDSIIAGLTHKEGEMLGSASFSFDYEHHLGDEWKIHIDYGVTVLPVAEIKVRSSFLLHCKEEELFSIPVLSAVIEESISNSVSLFMEQCKLNNIEFDADLPPNDEQVKIHSQHTIDLYYNYRKKDDLSNSKMKDNVNTMTFGENTLLVVKGTFMILDEILINNPTFDHKHNWDALSTCPIMEPFYLTLKANYLEIEKGEIELTFFQSVLFYLCLDVALQMLLSDHAETLKDVLLKNNFVPARQKEYISFGNEFYEGMNASLKKSGASVTNLEERRDWASIIR